jgi:hypothetical protein
MKATLRKTYTGYIIINDIDDVIASTYNHGLPIIDFNGIEDIVGYVDIQSMAMKPAIADSKVYTDSNTYDFRRGFEEGFRKAQDMFFSLYDINKAIEFGGDNETPFTSPYYSNFIGSLRRPEWIVECKVDKKAVTIVKIYE